VTEKIYQATVELTSYSKHRTKKSGMSAKALREAFMAGADFTAHNIDGRPCITVCSCSDFVDGATVTIVEMSGAGFYDTKCYFTFKPKVEQPAS